MIFDKFEYEIQTKKIEKLFIHVSAGCVCVRTCTVYCYGVPLDKHSMSIFDENLWHREYLYFIFSDLTFSIPDVFFSCSILNQNYICTA